MYTKHTSTQLLTSLYSTLLLNNDDDDVDIKD